MLTCVPQSVFSGSFDIKDAGRVVGSLAFNYWTEQGAIVSRDRRYSVVKGGMFSGRWTLERDGEACAEAVKSSPFFREFTLRTGGEMFTLRAKTLMGRGFRVLLGERPIGTIEPVSMFGRMSEIDCDSRLPEVDQLFAFWLVVLTWRRAARSRSAGAGHH